MLKLALMDVQNRILMHFLIYTYLERGCYAENKQETGILGGNHIMPALLF